LKKKNRKEKTKTKKRPQPMKKRKRRKAKTHGNKRFPSSTKRQEYTKGGRLRLTVGLSGN
jgi:hypothetical protein